MASAAMGSGEYVQHHLQHLNFNLKTFSFHGGPAFWNLHLDTFIISFVLGILFLGFFHHAARKAISGEPGPLQNFVEMAIETIDNLVKESFHHKNRMIAPLALTIFIWVFLMNFMDLIPVDLVPQGLSLFGVDHFRLVPTADPYLTFALSITVFLMVIYYNFKAKGFVQLGKEVLTKPFGKWAFPLNIVWRLLEEVVRPLSLSLRLFGNLFAGEMVFIMIALLPWWAQWLPGSIWSIFHILIIILQAFIFMMLTVVYLGMAHDSH